MKYRLIRTSNNATLTESTHINDPYLIQQVRDCFAYGRFKDGSVKLLINGVESDAQLILDRDDERESNRIKRKELTHKRVYVDTGVCSYKQNRKAVWAKKTK